MHKALAAVFVGLALAVSCFAQEQKFAELGDFKLESGEMIRDCRIGYRTYGKLNADASNAVLFTTWAGGTTEQAAGQFAPGGLIDTNKYFAIAVDAFANGVSSSPSNSKLQARMKFPQFTIVDNVNAQHEVLTKVLKIKHLYAVYGISMGGMQTFQWMVSYPDFMDKAIPIVGTPQPAPYDLILWETQNEVLMSDAAWKGGEYASNPSRLFAWGFGKLILTSPEDVNSKMTREQAFDEIAKARKDTGGMDVNDNIRQIRGMLSLDVTKNFAGSWERAAAVVKAKVLVIVATKDAVVTPGPALKFAKLINAKTVVLEGNCGHLATVCESSTVNTEIKKFLEQ
ncbi:MAG: alpha/beta fold hydrolase [Pyrinomonadaceae bacterium]